MLKKIKISWTDFGTDMKYIAEKIYKNESSKFKDIKNIYGVPRGGFIVAVCLSHLLELPMIWDKSKIDKNTLVVDDISDTGETLVKLLGKRKIRTVAYFQRQGTKYETDYFLHYAHDWVVFPWETLHSSKRDQTI